MNNMWKQDGSVHMQAQSAVVDAGLRSYMLSVYNYMASGLALTGIIALMAVQSEALMSVFYQLQPNPVAGGMPYIVGMKPMGWVVALSPLAVVLLLGFKIQSMSFQAAQMAFWGFSALMGLSMANLFLIYTGTSIARVFFITAITFGAMSLYGYTTKRDLTGFGSFLFMGLIGIIIASLVNIFLASTALHFVISVVGVLVFVGLTAYDTQRIKATYYAVSGSGETVAKTAIMGALNLYLDFINLFIMLLRFFGERR